VKNTISSMLIVGALVSGAALRSVNAEDIAIANSSFEEPALGDGSFNANNMPGWVGAGTFPVANPRDDWFFGTSAGSSLPNPIDGLNIGGINTGGSIHQDLTATVQPGVTYTLNMLVGHRLGVPFGNLTISMIANGQVLAEGIPPAPAEGHFAAFQLTYSSPTNGPVLGQTLRIELKSTGANAQPWFDNLKLTNGPPPPPPSGSDIAIANSSFEEPALADGAFNANNMPSWVGEGIFPVANPRDDWFFGTSAGSALPNPIDGLNIGGINTGGTIHQDLTATVQPGLTYTLNMLVGRRLGNPFGTLTVSLIANGQVLAEEIPPAPEEGRFASFQLTYSSPTNGPVLGQTLRIQLKSTGLNAQPWFDNLKLTNAPPPPPPGSDIAIANSSFEEPALADGTFNANNMPGWVGVGTFHVANPSDDWFVRTSAGSALPNPIDGLNIGGLNTGGSIHQDLTATVQPGLTYTLTMLVGRRLGNPFGTLTVSILAGGQVLAEGIPTAPEEGHFAPFQLTYSSPTNGPALGQTLRIQLQSTGTGAQAWFDNLKLTNGPPPPPPPGSDIAIANFSFEEPALADGAFNANNMPGWVGVGTFPVANPRDDWFFWTSAGSSLPTPIDGLNIAGLNTGSSIHQDLTATVQPGVTYTLNMLVGRRLGVPFGTLTVSLMAGGQVLAEGTPAAPADGRFAPFQLAYASATNGPVLGQTLRIELKSTGANAQPWFDNLKLTLNGTPVELPPSITAQPQSQSVTRGDSVVFRVGAFGSNPLFYQWAFNGIPIEGANDSTLTLNSVQLNQAGNYSAWVSNALGTASSSNAVLVVNHPPATVRVVNANGAGAAEISVPVELVANGNENALGFSLNFNATVLSFVGASVGVGAPSGAALLVNTNDVAAGRLGLAVGLPADEIFSEGTQQVALITFLVAPVLNQITVPVTFGNQPTLRQLSDVHAQVLPAVFVGGTVSISDSQFEADVAPRPSGDRSVATIDWVQMGRFVARLDTVSGPNEFQRADCAPRATKGNGKLSASDWVQAGRYAVGLDPLTVLGGPTGESKGEGGFAAASTSGRQLCLANTSIAQGQTNTVPVTLACQGNENAATFSVTFDTAKLAFVSATPGAGSAGGLLNLNTSEVSQGRLGVAMAAQPGTTFPQGTREILKLQFATLVTAPATATLGFGNVPVPREVSDATANPLAAEYTAGTVTVTPLPGPPLRVTRTGNSLFITWPSSATGFELEGTAGAFGTAWSAVPGVIDLGEQKLAIVPIGGGERYFRLKKP